MRRRSSAIPGQRAARALAASLLLAMGAGTVADAAETQAPAAMPADHPPIVTVPAQAAPRLPLDTVMAHVGNDVVTAADVDAAINATVGPERFEYTAPEPLRELVEALVDRKLMARAARAAGIDKEPAIRKQLAPADTSAAPPPEQVLADAWLERQLAAIAAPTEAQVAQYYRDHTADFTEPARARVTRVVTANRDAAERMRGELSRGATAEDILERHADAVVSAESLWLQDAAKKTEMIAVALALKAGQVSAAVPVPAGFAVMRSDERVPARLRPLAEVSAGIGANLATSARQGALVAIRARLRNGVRVSLVDAALVSFLAAN